MESPLFGVAPSSKLLPGSRHAPVSECQANSNAHVVVLVCFGACFNARAAFLTGTYRALCLHGF